MTLLFEKHLEQTSTPALAGSPTPFLDEDTAQLAVFLRTFAEGLDTTADLESECDAFCQVCEMDEAETESFKDTLVAVVGHAYGNDPSDEHIKAFLKQLQKAKPTTTTLNKDGMTPLAGEGAIKSFLRSLTVDKHPQPYGTNAYDASNYKVFDREASRYGYNHSAANDYNDQRPSRPLANPTLNVDTNNKAFEAVDAVGLGAKVQWRVINKLTNEYVTRQIEKTQAEEIAADLNRDFVEALHENNLTTDDVDKVVAEARRAKEPIASTPITENILKPLSPQSLAAFEKATRRNNYTTAGNVSQSSYSSSPVNDIKVAAKLINERKRTFGESNLISDELTAIHQQQRKR